MAPRLASFYGRAHLRQRRPIMRTRYLITSRCRSPRVFSFAGRLHTSPGSAGLLGTTFMSFPPNDLVYKKHQASQWVCPIAFHPRYTPKSHQNRKRIDGVSRRFGRNCIRRSVSSVQYARSPPGS
ncbi:hypothetical protein LX32DRAFT_169492 [Colletotrichum zoysiae]|uniref:Uncharacterized protein n=1 Tax=Colletotrichum zoysiae TaxID=1216348 RepID=A0AAD9M5P3_9PEZI|nr:hypothetical protein LX32DRAFT_169492 [Colletotrichum zoysiae]